MSESMKTPRLGNDVTEEEWEWLSKFIGTEIPRNLSRFSLSIDVRDVIRFHMHCVAERDPPEEADVTTRGDEGWKRSVRVGRIN